MLVQLRRERGLTMAGDYRLPLVALNRLILQSGLTMGIGKLAFYVGIIALFSYRDGVPHARQLDWKRSAPRCFAARCCPC